MVGWPSRNPLTDAFVGSTRCPYPLPMHNRCMGEQRMCAKRRMRGILDGQFLAHAAVRSSLPQQRDFSISRIVIEP